jgi:hypothetical protein
VTSCAGCEMRDAPSFERPKSLVSRLTPELLDCLPMIWTFQNGKTVPHTIQIPLVLPKQTLLIVVRLPPIHSIKLLDQKPATNNWGCWAAYWWFGSVRTGGQWCVQSNLLFSIAKMNTFCVLRLVLSTAPLSRPGPTKRSRTDSN